MSTGFVDLAPRSREVFYTVAGAGQYGMNWVEVARNLNLHHGQASGALSSLHRRGFVARLTEKRDRCSVYVANRYLLDRDTIPYPSEKPAEVSESDECTRIECQTVLAMYESLQAENARLKERLAVRESLTRS